MLRSITHLDMKSNVIFVEPAVINNSCIVQLEAKVLLGQAKIWYWMEF